MAATKSLLSRGESLADPGEQLKLLAHGSEVLSQLPRFEEQLGTCLRPAKLEILQMNLGKMCNQTCKHCHVDAGPDRKEIMARETMEACLKAIEGTSVRTVDLTGGAPEMNPDFRWLVEQLTGLGKEVIVRCNLTIVVANKKYHDLPQFYRQHGVHIVSSLPYYDRRQTDRQRGDHVFSKSIEVLQILNREGYGKEGSGLLLDLVYNPAGAFLPPSQASLESDFKKELKSRFDIEFNSLYAITNMPISRYLEYLQMSGNLNDYMEKLVNAYNPAAADSVMCRNTLSVGWDGQLFDCDFNQMLEMKVSALGQGNIRDFNLEALNDRVIRVDQHCYGCTAGSGSSCGGELTV